MGASWPRHSTSALPWATGTFCTRRARSAPASSPHDDPLWRKRLVGIYRHVDLAHITNAFPTANPFRIERVGVPRGSTIRQILLDCDHRTY
jgi:hypothetical protein